MNNDTRQLRKAAATNVAEAPKPRPRAPLEKVPGETVLELLEKSKMKEVAAMGRAAVPALIGLSREYGRGTPNCDYKIEKKIRLTFMMMGFERHCTEMMNNHNVRSREYGECKEYVRKLLDEDEDFESLKRCSVKGEPILGKRDAEVLRRFLEEAQHLRLLELGHSGYKNQDFSDVEVIDVKANDVEKLFSIMCAMDEYLFDTLMHLCLPISERIQAMILNAGPQAIPVLINGLSNGSEQAQSDAEDMLAAMGEPAVLPLMAVLEDENSKGRMRAADALGEIRDIRAVPALIEAAKHTGDELQYGIIEAVGKIAEKHPEYDWRAVAMVLVDLCDDSCDWAVCGTLEIIGAVTTDPELKRVLKEKGFLPESG
ncbi:HEAT repeat domain-containing protein [Candidatus Micrarchaeota archaeon]|nr:HEAT repeat domain-containing protein [Candidatus Micrarchaeota archaeon]